ncbi:MAG: hypothetical protein KUG77_16870 [Nannocystaceae bacterium]|nr:hypothetical protein [Nannocystaceae bacterium]
MRSGTVTLLVITMLGCGSTTDDPAEESGSSTTSPDAGSSTTDIVGSSSSTGGTLESSNSEGGESSSEGGGPAPTFGEPESLPTPDGACPSFESGTLEFAPAETGPRSARVWVDPEAGGGGPLVFYWHGTGSNPLEAEYGLGQAGIDDILERGGMVVAPVSDPEAGQFPWFLVLGQEEDDIHLMDEIVGCAAAGPGIDPSRIHALGMSAGGLQTSQASVRRSSYIASVVTYSGGILNPEIVSDDPDRPFPALIYHGGPQDIVVVSFQQASERYRAHIESLGGYSVICDHGGGHTIPDARVYSWQFLLDHPYDITPLPYEGTLPRWIPDYCAE